MVTGIEAIDKRLGGLLPCLQLFCKAIDGGKSGGFVVGIVFVVAYGLVQVHHFHEECRWQGVFFFVFQHIVESEDIGHGGIGIAKGLVGLVDGGCHGKRLTERIGPCGAEPVGVVLPAEFVEAGLHRTRIGVQRDRNIKEFEVVGHRTCCRMSIALVTADGRRIFAAKLRYAAHRTDKGKEKVAG